MAASRSDSAESNANKAASESKRGVPARRAPAAAARAVATRGVSNTTRWRPVLAQTRATQPMTQRPRADGGARDSSVRGRQRVSAAGIVGVSCRMLSVSGDGAAAALTASRPGCMPESPMVVSTVNVPKGTAEGAAAAAAADAATAAAAAAAAADEAVVACGTH